MNFHLFFLTKQTKHNIFVRTAAKGVCNINNVNLTRNKENTPNDTEGGK